MTVEEAIKLFTERGFYAKLSGATGNRHLFVASKRREIKTTTHRDKANTIAKPASRLQGESITAPSIKALEGLEPLYQYDEAASVNETDGGWLFSAMYADVEMLFTSFDEAVQTLEAWFKDILELGDYSMSVDDAVQVLKRAELKADVTNNIAIIGSFGLRGENMRSLKSYGIMRHGGILIVVLPNDTIWGRITIITNTLFQAVQEVLTFYGKEG